MTTVQSFRSLGAYGARTRVSLFMYLRVSATNMWLTARLVLSEEMATVPFSRRITQFWCPNLSENLARAWNESAAGCARTLTRYSGPIVRSYQ